MEVVALLERTIAERIGLERYAAWFAPQGALSLSADRLTIRVPGEFIRDWMRHKYGPVIQEACRDKLRRSVTIEYQIDEQLAAAAASDSTADNSAACRATEPNATVPKPPACRRFSSFSSFVVGDSNRLAHTAAEMVAQGHDCLVPLLLHGPTSVGKTHLLEAIWSAVRSARRDVHGLFLSAEQFTSQFVAAVHGGGMPSFRHKYRGVDLLVMDDLHILAGKAKTADELVRTIDSLLAAGKRVVFAADRPATAFDEISAELATRLKAGMACRIERPEYDTRLAIVRQLGAARGLVLCTLVADYIATNVVSNARELAGAVNRLLATSHSLGQAVTLPMAQEALAELLHATGRDLRLDDIEKALCETFGVAPKSLRSGDRSRECSHPRMLAMWLARKHTRSPLGDIGRHFGGRRHTTVISAQQRVEKLIAKGQKLQLADRKWDVTEAIRRVEHALRVG